MASRNPLRSDHLLLPFWPQSIEMVAYYGCSGTVHHAFVFVVIAQAMSLVATGHTDDTAHGAAKSGGQCALLNSTRGGPYIGTESIKGVPGTSASACCAACAEVPQCVAFTLSIDVAKGQEMKSTCWLKPNAQNSTASKCPHDRCISGTNGREPSPPPPPCSSFSTSKTCLNVTSPRRCYWDGKHCGNPPPAPPPPGPCAAASRTECGIGRGPYNGSIVYCAAGPMSPRKLDERCSLSCTM
eukprot:SAG31_NODE_140_length_22731_cov_10.941410_8_plen_241_part_00